MIHGIRGKTDALPAANRIDTVLDTAGWRRFTARVMDLIGTALIAALAGGGAAWLWWQSRAAALAERQRLPVEQAARAESELTALRARVTTLEAEKSRLETLLTAERDALAQAQTRLTDTFKALAVGSFGATLLPGARKFAKLGAKGAKDLPEVRRAGPDEIVVGRDTFANEPPLVALSVLDQGSGIPPEVLSRIFEPYYTTKADSGTGLGLAIVSRLIQTHRGLLRLKTRVGEGTALTVYFPAREPTPSNNPFKG